MGQIDINLCVTTPDGSVFYAFISTNKYDGKPPAYAPYGDPVHYVLLKSSPDPSSLQSAGWTFLASIPETSSYKFDGGWPAYQCRVDSAGVATLFVSDNYPVGSKTSVNRPKGIQWDPKGTITSTTGATGTGGWTLLDSDEKTLWKWTSPAILGIINSQPTLVYVEEYTKLTFSALSPTSKTFTRQSYEWTLTSLGTAQYIEMLEYGNGKLYALGTGPSGLTLTTMPLTALGSAPSTSLMTSSSYPTGACTMSHYFAYMTLVGNEIYGLCTRQSAGYIYHHDGQSWQPPIVLPSVPFSTPGAGRFFRTQAGEVWGFAQDYKSAYIIKIKGNTASWDRSGPVIIPQNFGIAADTTATSTTSGAAVPSNTNTNNNNGTITTQDGGGGLGGGAIGGIVAGVLVVALIAAFFVFRARKGRNFKKHPVVGGENDQNKQTQQVQIGGEPSYPPMVPPKEPGMNSPVMAYPHVMSVPAGQYPFVYNDGTSQQAAGFFPQHQVTGPPVHMVQPYQLPQTYPNTFPVTYPPANTTLVPQTSFHQPAPVSILSVNTKGIDVPVSQPAISQAVDPNIQVSSPALSTTATLVNVTQFPPIPSHSRPDVPLNNPQYRPE